MAVGDKRSRFGRFARAAASVAGRPVTFAVALTGILVWGVTGPIFGYSDTWQLVVNTATTIITFLMVFLIQNTQARDAEAMHIKIDELIRAIEGAHNALLDLEELDERDLEKIRATYTALASQARKSLLDPEDVCRQPLDLLGNAVAMQGADREGLENQQVEGAGQEFGPRRAGCHSSSIHR